MKAMVLAAGLGTRLRPLTNDRPKALVEVGGRTMLEITLLRLRSAGVKDVIVNVHHFADKVVEYLASHGNFGLHIETSREDDLLLDTGGGLQKATWFFAGSDEPFFLHNVDVISTIDLGAMLRFHVEQNALATLAVQTRQTTRQLLFDEKRQLCGRHIAGSPPELARQATTHSGKGFCGVHVISPRMLRKMNRQGAYSIIDTYLQLASEGERIMAFDADAYYWRDLGKPESIRQAESEIASKAT